MKAKRFNCIIVKDLSRFGRDHIGMGHYLEQVLPENRIRFIAVLDNEDSSKGLSDFVPFKNLFNEWYAKDTSRKVKAALRSRFENGMYYATYAPLGYRKGPAQAGHLIPDEANRWIVEHIFALACQGYGSGQIARTLFKERVPTPGWLIYTTFGGFARCFRDKPESKAFGWSAAQVKAILANEVYLGHSIHYRTETISFKNKKQIRNPKEDWVRIENTHAPLVTQQVFDQVQGMIASRRRVKKDLSLNLFGGILKCADCGRTLCYSENRQGRTPLGFYICTKSREAFEKCTYHYVRHDLLYDYVLSRLQHWITLVQSADPDLERRVVDLLSKKDNLSLKKSHAALNQAQKRKESLDHTFAKLYVIGPTIGSQSTTLTCSLKNIRPNSQSLTQRLLLSPRKRKKIRRPKQKMRRG